MGLLFLMTFGLLVFTEHGEWKIFLFSMSCCVMPCGVAIWQGMAFIHQVHNTRDDRPYLSGGVQSEDLEKMSGVSEMIREGAEAFLATQYKKIAVTAGVASVVLFVVYLFREPPKEEDVNRFTAACAVTLSFLLGAACSSASGYAGLALAVHANLAVARCAVEVAPFPDSEIDA